MQRIGTHKYVRYPHNHQSINFCLGWIHTPYRHRYTHSHSLSDAGKVFFVSVSHPFIFIPLLSWIQNCIFCFILRMNKTSFPWHLVRNERFNKYWFILLEAFTVPSVETLVGQGRIVFCASLYLTTQSMWLPVTLNK